MLKIMDFGLAKILEAVRQGSSTVIAGTPFSMPPEQASGNIADGRTDLCALGVTLFELSTGRLPFKEGAVGTFLARGGDCGYSPRAPSKPRARALVRVRHDRSAYRSPHAPRTRRILLAASVHRSCGLSPGSPESICAAGGA